MQGTMMMPTAFASANPWTLFAAKVPRKSAYIGASGAAVTAHTST
jgi:hypothetical protein